jgi:putative endonuclease
MLSRFSGKTSCVIAKLASASPKKDPQHRLGAHYEDAALAYLRQNGLQLLTQNYRCRFGEIDLVMRHQKCLVFVEVRFRSRNRFAGASLTVDHRKQAKLLKTAAMFLSQHRRHADDTVRFDVLAFDRTDSASSTIQWIKDAFRP